jgi:hypothetical protein
MRHNSEIVLLHPDLLVEGSSLVCLSFLHFTTTTSRLACELQQSDWEVLFQFFAFVATKGAPKTFVDGIRHRVRDFVFGAPCLKSHRQFTGSYRYGTGTPLRTHGHRETY